MTVVTYTTPTTANWTAPAGVTLALVACWGSGGGGGDYHTTTNSGGGGGGGEYADESTLAVTGGNSYSYTVAAAGTAGHLANGGNGNSSTFTGNSVTVTAYGGQGGGYSTSGAPAGGTKGTGSGNTHHHDGGAGGPGYNAGEAGGGGGGGSGGSGGAGGTGGTGSIGTTGSGGAAGAAGATSGGIGGIGGNGASGTTGNNGHAPASGPGGGGGGGGSGYAGCVDLATEIYTQRGWLHYDQVRAGDITLGLANGKEVSSVVRFLRTFPGAKMFSLRGDDFEFRVSDVHRNLVLSNGEWAYKHAADLTPTDQIQLRDRLVSVSDLTITEDGEDSLVWCPNTEAGNWLARRNGVEWFTGNKPDGGAGYAGQVQITYTAVNSGFFAFMN